MRDLIGRTLGHYRIVDKIGEGGMGEVYRAHDEHLDRDVAIKVLPEAVAEDPQRLARFEREAKLLASLSHQNVATLHGLEKHEGQRFLVMELAEGETLAERAKRGSIPIEDALDYARQIAEGLEAAHEVGIIHRDLKPANVMVSPEGTVKVLDFGLAKAWQPEGSDVDITHSPTLTGHMTAAGILLGTAAYMSPEQARGKAADKRADIWAFGVMLFEMLTCTRLFEGETTSDVLAAVLRAEPEWSELPAETPRAIVRLLRRCLERDPRERLHDVADARLEIEEAVAQPSWAAMDQPEPTKLTFRDTVRAAWPMVLGAAIVAALLAAGVTWKISEVRWAATRRPMHLALNLPPGVTLKAGQYPALAVSPDGRWLVFEAKQGGTWKLFKRSLEQTDATPIPGTEDAYHPFFSPDGLWVGFSADGKLKKVPVAGGTPQVLADATDNWGTTWGSDGTIVFNPSSGRGLWRVPATGGTPELLIEPDPEHGVWDLNWPEFLPDGEAVLFTSLRSMSASDAKTEVLDLESRGRTTLIENGSYARFVPSGHLIFGRAGGLHVVPFDAERREVTGPSVPVPEPIFCDHMFGASHLAFSSEGTLAYVPSGGLPKHQLLSVGMDAKEAPLIEARRGFDCPRFSPDGGRLAVTISEPGDLNLWVLDLATGARTKLTFEGNNSFPVWTPDGTWVSFCSYGGSKPGIYRKRADGSGEAELLVAPEEPGEWISPNSWTPDGNTLVYGRFRPSRRESGADLWILDRGGDRQQLSFLGTQGSEASGAISPDGQWLAYVSNESGRREIYVQPFPHGGERYQISTDGGLKPIWSPDGRSIYYRRDDQVLAVSISSTPRFRAEAPRVLLKGNYAEGDYMFHPDFDIAPDGKSFVLIKADEEWGKATEIRVVLNWFEELKRLAPTE